MQNHHKFSTFAWLVLVYNLMVIAWGAYVRATGSGAGCGAHWPLCNGEIIPRSPEIETMVEFSHRVSSGLTLVLAILLVIFAYRRFSRGSLVRKGAVFTLFFTLTEAMVGAGLVLFELVAQNASITRALSMMLHLINTYLLLGSLTLTSWWSSQGETGWLRWPGVQGVVLMVALVSLLVLGASGAIAALGDTLFPVASLGEGIQQELSPTAHFLVRLRVLHPLIAASAGVYLLVAVTWLRRRVRTPAFMRLTNILLGIFVFQLILGAVNVILLAPVWLQMVHLVVSDLIWITLVLSVEVVFSRRESLKGFTHQPIEVAVE